MSFVVVCLFLGTFSTTSCVKEDEYLESLHELQFSVDTLSFDTVFTTLGSTTKQVKVYNTSNRPIKFDKVSLKEGGNSRFRINVDGDTSLVIRDFTIASHDSAFIFVRVNINPNSSTSPFLVEDGIVFELGNISTDSVWSQCNIPHPYQLSNIGRSGVQLFGYRLLQTMGRQQTTHNFRLRCSRRRQRFDNIARHRNILCRWGYAMGVRRWNT